MKGLYIHIPFCERKCRYCDFPSYGGKFSFTCDYVSALAAEAEEYRGFRPDTVYIGGGTPSALPSGLLLRLVREIGEKIDLSGAVEFSSEANPNSFTKEKALEFREAGVTRLSLGLQSSDEKMLRYLGRLHSPSDFTEAVENALEAGISNVNADMMYSLPGQTVKNVSDTVDFILSHSGIKHVSAYALRLEEGTPLYDEHPVLPDDNTDRLMFHTIEQKLEDSGFGRYEISNFSLPGFECAHNLIYWRAQEYVGLGCGAHSFYNGKRYFNPPELEEYLHGTRRLGEEAPDPFDRIMLGTRLIEGIPVSLLPDNPEVSSYVSVLVSHGLARIRGGRFALTSEGLDIQNSILTDLMLRMPE